jgi:hypothetical protein
METLIPNFNQLDAHQQRVATAQIYLMQNEIYYGQPHEQTKQIEQHSPSWMIADRGFNFTVQEAAVLQEDMPRAMSDFATLSTAIMRSAFTNQDDGWQEVREGLLANVPAQERFYLEELFRIVSSRETNEMPFSLRPDVQLTEDGQMRIVEVNDHNADKGNTEAVNQYSEQMFGKRPLGTGLTEAFAAGLNGSGEGTIATILPSAYRTEYHAQNRFFARNANDKVAGAWLTAETGEIQLTADGLFVPGSYGLVKVDTVDREFQLPGFIEGYDFRSERILIEAYLANMVAMPGSLLPFNDKLLISYLFNRKFELFANATLGDNSGSKLNRLRSLFAETVALGSSGEAANVSALSDYDYFSGLAYGDILSGEVPLVLKRTGNNSNATEARGVIISTDTRKDLWGQWVRHGFQNGGFILQRFYPSVVREVAAHDSYRSKRQVNPDGKYRIAPYYVSSEQGYQLGNVLVTATVFHREKKLRSTNVIHAQRGTAYQAAYLAAE